MSTQASTINVSTWMDDHRLSPFQIGVVTLCGCIALVDGFDLQIVSFVTPVLAKQWKVPSAAFGSVYTLGLIGTMLGGLIAGPIADKVGRKAVTIASLLVFSALALATATVTSLSGLTLLRFLTGVGLGGCLPGAIALTAEYSPRRLRRSLVTTMLIGYPAGTFIAGIVAANLIPRAGWASVFIVGGAIPLALSVVALFALPESVHFLAGKGTRVTRIAPILRRVAPSAATQLSFGETVYLVEKRAGGFPARQLFTDGRARNTLLLWAAYSMNLVIIYFAISWLPTLLIRAGLPLTESIFGVVALQGGAIIGGLVMGYGTDRVSPQLILGCAYALGAIALALVGVVHGLAAVMPVLFLVGVLVIGAQISIAALAASIYPTSARSTGVGWASGVAKVGSIVGPLIGAAFIANQWPLTRIFLIVAIPAVLAALAVAGMRVSATQANEAELQGITVSAQPRRGAVEPGIAEA